ncbi:MAG: glycosyltransferase family 4 protein, partial [Rhodospirillaceae bacterium]
NSIKGQIQMVEALPALRARWPGLTVRMVGDGSRADSLRARAAELGVADALDLAGLVEDVTGELQAADLLVSTSHYEGAPMGILEAMGQGVPVVASDVPGTRAVVRPGETGRLYPLHDISALVDAITAALNGPEETALMARIAWRETAERSSCSAMTRAYVRLYQDCLCVPTATAARAPSAP